jgi:microcin C transport system permease protein
MTLSPLNARRLQNFRANRRGRWSLWLFAVLFVASLFAELIANDKPIVVSFAGDVYFPVFEVVPETTFGGFLETEAEYKDPEVRELIEEQGWIVWPLVPFSYDSINFELSVPAPAPPSAVNWLGTDDQGRDVLARLIYGFRISVLFGLTLTLISSVIGVIAGAVQGYRLDRSALPALHRDLVGAAAALPSDHPGQRGRAQLLVAARPVAAVLVDGAGRRGAGRVPARAQLRLRTRRTRPGCGQRHHHLLPNAMVATLTFMPFILNGSITTLTALDFLGFGLPPGSPSLGELLNQGKNNLQAPWLGLTAFAVLAVMLSLLIFIGEAVRDAFDPRKTTA